MNMGSVVEDPRRPHFYEEDTKKARLDFAKMHVDKPQSFWENVLWTDETKLEPFGKSHQPYVSRGKTEH